MVQCKFGNYIKGIMQNNNNDNNIIIINCACMYVCADFNWFKRFLINLSEGSGNPHVSECHCNDEEQESM